jgi:hypothetical protein
MPVIHNTHRAYSGSHCIGSDTIPYIFVTILKPDLTEIPEPTHLDFDFVIQSFLIRTVIIAL